MYVVLENTLDAGTVIIAKTLFSINEGVNILSK